jgi:predicted metalloprotease
MRRRPLASLFAAALAAASLSACGSSHHTSTTGTTKTGTTRTETTAHTVVTTTTPIPAAHGRTVIAHLAGVKGAAPTLVVVHRFARPHGSVLGAHVKGLAGLDVSQKLQAISGQVASMWQLLFSKNGVQLPAANVALVQDTPVSCGSSQYTSTSPPAYCPATQTIILPVGTMTAKIAPLGDAALLLMVANLYGYHVENALGAFGRGLSSAALEKMDSCFSGVYFLYAEATNELDPTDEEGVNNLLALEAPAGTGATAAGSVSAQDLASAFNQGIMSNFKYASCLPPGT